MNIPRLHGILLLGSALSALLAGLAFYFLLIGVFERPAATISLVLFVTVSAVVWTRPDGEHNRKARRRSHAVHGVERTV